MLTEVDIMVQLSDGMKDVLDAINIAIMKMESNGSILLKDEIYNVAGDSFTQDEANVFSESLAKLIQVSFNAGSRY